MTAPIVPTNPDAAVTVPSGADMPATVTNGVRRSVEYVGRGELEHRVRDAERNLAALDAYVKDNPKAAEAANGPRAMYEQIRDDSNEALGPQNVNAVPAGVAAPPARSGVKQSDTNTTTNHDAGEGEE